MERFLTQNDPDLDMSTGVRSDHTVILTALASANLYPNALRRVSFLDVATTKFYRFLSVTLFEKTPILQGT
jgi:hypothetical protein